ncbi:MAG: diaminopimelate epimerase, partial [Paenisporosarcina sp.]|nr:diaminopimelate epimerase [Paenisporosarcina sp.]
ATINLVPFGEVTVYNPGGFVKCVIEQHGEHVHLSLIGNATFFATYSGELSDDGEFLCNSIILHEHEIKEYKELEHNSQLKIKDGWSRNENL